MPPTTQEDTINLTSCDIWLTPSGTLRMHGTASRVFADLEKAFSSDWREGWFLLAAQKLQTSNFPSLKFWQGISSQFLTQICHLPTEKEFSPLPPPPAESFSERILRAPPMTGGEYLNLQTLIHLWNQLNEWVGIQEKTHGGIHSFLKEKAPKWQQVGRVCFHLGENKNNPSKPFAFLATYSTGFNASGKLSHLPLKKALEQYAGKQNKQALIKLLTPIQLASEKFPWIHTLLTEGEIYQPLAWTTGKAYKLLTVIPELEMCGLAVRIPNWWEKRPRPKVNVSIGSGTDSKVGMGALLSFNLSVALGEEELSHEELEQILQSTESLVSIRGQWVEVDKEKLQEVIDQWKKLRQKYPNGQVSFIEGMRMLAGATPELRDEKLSEEHRDWFAVSASDTLRDMLQKLRDPSQLHSPKEINGLHATLREYQQEGVNWLSFLCNMGLGACLADDMGLGKTIQVLSLLLQEQCKKPSLLIVPASLLGNWKREAEKFTPSLRLVFVHPSETDRKKLEELAKDPKQELQQNPIVVTTYSTVIRQPWLSDVSWNFIILDEAQAIKNPSAKQSKAVRKLQSEKRIALTGTPIENRLSDLWSLFDFINPGLLGSANDFNDFIKEQKGLPSRFESLRKMVSPYILRRMKTDPTIIADLPEKIETPSYCQLTKQQASCYQSIVNELALKLEKIDPKERRGIVLQTLLQLKQVCNHPSHFAGDNEYDPTKSGKFQRLMQICEELASRQEKVLIFTQFREIIDPLAAFLENVYGERGLTLHGGTAIKERKKIVEKFQNDSCYPYLILSLKAGGTGLTLTAASHVIHFDRWWNPAVENQATDRAFRIGQKKNVMVHKFITQGTLEEKIDEIIDSKKALSNEILSGEDEIKITDLSDEELLKTIALDINRATQV